MALVKIPIQKRSQLLVDSIIKAAIEILKQPSMSSFTTNHIAQSSGVSIGSLYQYFSTKEDILDEVIIYYFSNQHTQIISSISQVNFSSRKQYIKEILNMFYKNIFDELNFSNTLAQKAQSMNIYERIKALDKALFEEMYIIIKNNIPELSFKDFEVVIYAIKGINMQYGNNLTKEQALEYTQLIANSILRS